MRPTVTALFDRVVAVRIVAHDPEALTRFYVEVLGAEAGTDAAIPPAEAALFGAGERRTLRIGVQRLDIDAFAEPGAPYPSYIAANDPRFQHIALVTVDIDAVFIQALEAGAQSISQGSPVRLPKASGGATAVKLRDPEGHPFELLALPSGPWDGVEPNARGIRGLDHSAVTVTDIDVSRRFYAELGLAERGATFNQGAEQAALDGLDAPHVAVAPLFPAGETPHLELLGYQALTRPTAAVADRDVAATRVVWSVPHTAGIALLRDPDGHRHLLQAP